MADIKNLIVNTSNLSQAGGRRKLNIIGDVGASFKIIVKTITADTDKIPKSYNFLTDSFQDEFTSACVLNKTLINTSFVLDLIFPAVNGSSYDIVLVSDNITINKQIDQGADTTVTLDLFTSNSSSFASFPTSSVVTGSPSETSSKKLSFDYTVTSAAPSAGGFGFFLSGAAIDFKGILSKIDPFRLPTFSLNSQSLETSLIFQSTQTVDGAGNTTGNDSGPTVVKLDSVANLGVGTRITAVSSGSLNTSFDTKTKDSAVITRINTEDKEITIANTQNFADGITLTFLARGSKAVSAALGVTLRFLDIEIIPVTVPTTTVRASGSGTTVNVNGTHGIPGNSTTEFFGRGVNNSSTNNINVVTASDSAGSFTCDVSQDFAKLNVGTTLSFAAVAGATEEATNYLLKSFRIKGVLDISNMPTSNATIQLSLDKIIIPGVSGS